MANLRVTLVQESLYWQDAAHNRQAFGALLEQVTGRTDLVVLPELFTTGFSMDSARLAEPMQGATVGWLRATAQRLDAAIVGSVIVREGEATYNRLLFVEPGGEVRHYDKRHLFRMGGEHEHYSPGRAPIVVDWRGFRILPLVCYDLRFPVYSRRRPGLDYDAIVYVANWPAARTYAWRQLRIARAIENQAFVIGVNRVGLDGVGVQHTGHSGVYDFLGMPLVEQGEDPRVDTVELHLEPLRRFREKFPAQLDADRFTLLP